MEFKEALEVGTYLLAILGGISGGILFLWRGYRGALSEKLAQISRTWSNEGLVFGESQDPLITVRLKNHEGDIIGELQANSLGHLLELHVTPGWPSCRVSISQINRSNLTHIGTAKVRIVGNKNRLQWRITEGGLPEILAQPLSGQLKVHNQSFKPTPRAARLNSKR